MGQPSIFCDPCSGILTSPSPSLCGVSGPQGWQLFTFFWHPLWEPWIQAAVSPPSGAAPPCGEAGTNVHRGLKAHMDAGELTTSPGGPGLAEHQGPLPTVSRISPSPPPMLLKLHMALLNSILPEDEPRGPNEFTSEEPPGHFVGNTSWKGVMGPTSGPRGSSLLRVCFWSE